MVTAISPNYIIEMFPNGMTLENKIAVFEDRVRGWQLNHAEFLLRSDRHSAFAAMHIAMSYFESIAKFRYGNRSLIDSPKYFEIGFLWVFPELETLEPDPKIRKDVLSKIYSRARSGLYHTGVTGAGFSITANIAQVIQPDHERDVIRLNPHKMVESLNPHLSRYVAQLRNLCPHYNQLRKCFECRFDWLRNKNMKNQDHCEKPPEE